MRKILILGAGGMLGHKLCQQFSAVGQYEVCATVRGQAQDYRRYRGVYDGVRLIEGLDVLDETRLDRTLDHERPQVIVNCIGIVKQLDEARNRAISVAINTCLPHRLARIAERTQSRLIHISTDCVFDGVRGGYTEEDLSNARDLYGQSKYLGETGEEERTAVTLRTSIIGRELDQPTHGLVEWFLAQRGKTVGGFSRAIYTGFTTLELARVIRKVIDSNPELCGTYHVASAPISKYILLQSIRRSFGLDIEIEENEDFECDRSMTMAKFSKTTGYVAPDWDHMIREMSDDPTPYDSWNART